MAQSNTGKVQELGLACRGVSWRLSTISHLVPLHEKTKHIPMDFSARSSVDPLTGIITNGNGSDCHALTTLYRKEGCPTIQLLAMYVCFYLP
jgi:hypothetical protein